MQNDKLLNCPFCNGEAELEEFYESCDGRGDRFAKIKCKCGATMKLTVEEWGKAQDDFNYTGGYYSQNKAFWNGMHQRLIDKWNTRKPMERIVERLEEVSFERYGNQGMGGELVVNFDDAIEIGKGGVDNAG